MTAVFHPLVQEWFEGRFGLPTDAQARGWPAIAAGENTLIAAPTGAGKTLAAFLWSIDRLVQAALNNTLADRTYVIYVSPLKALSKLETTLQPGKVSSSVPVRGSAAEQQPPMEWSHSPVAERLLEISRRLEPGELLPSLLPEASAFARENPYAFCIATCLDRQMSAEVVWTIPYYMRRGLGHLDPMKIGAMTRDDLEALFGRLPRKPRFVNDAPPTVMDITRIILKEAGGEASNLWLGKTAAQVRSTFRRVHGVGPGIAAMAVLLIERVFGVKFSDLDHTTMEIKPDVHTVRVLFRLGVANVQTAEAAIGAARELNPAYPGEIDGALWRIGKNWCHALLPDCTACPMNDLCPKVGF